MNGSRRANPRAVETLKTLDQIIKKIDEYAINHFSYFAMSESGRHMTLREGIHSYFPRSSHQIQTLVPR